MPSPTTRATLRPPPEAGAAAARQPCGRRSPRASTTKTRTSPRPAPAAAATPASAEAASPPAPASRRIGRAIRSISTRMMLQLHGGRGKSTSSF
uniref:Uncharacterized protein n=1 Tax=Arundo donax TaxID=35708 RepID=A0A0A9CLG8_ARUDO